jgi:hypothetical protein
MNLLDKILNFEKKYLSKKSPEGSFLEDFFTYGKVWAFENVYA